MKKDQFDGSLKSVSPNLIVNPQKDDEFDNFFLVLALIYNDLKGLTFFEQLLKQKYQEPRLDEVTFHRGEYSGILVHIQRLYIGMIHEFFEFLVTNRSIIGSIKFKLFFKKIPYETECRWNEIVDIALKRTVAASDFSSRLIKIRNNASFHYYHSEKVLTESFRKYFFKKEKHNTNKKAYYYIGCNMEGSRFFYADACAEEYINMIDYDGSTIEVTNFGGKIFDVIRDMNGVILALMNQYLNSKIT